MISSLFILFRRYTVSSVLNILGLTIAFTAFIIIMVQYGYDIRFDSFYSKGDRTYRVEYSDDRDGCRSVLSRPVGEHIIGLSPNVEAGSVYSRADFWFTLADGDPDKFVSEPIIQISPVFTDMVDFNFVEGDGSRLEDLYSVVISERIARKLFPEEKAMGKELRFRSSGDGWSALVVTGVYRDFPQNSFMAANPILINMGDSYINNTSEWSYNYYITLCSPDQRADFEELLQKYAKERFASNSDMRFRLTSLPEQHFSDISNDYVPKANLTTMNVLLGVAFVILFIAVINFINFAMAMVPMQIHGINIRKILGASVAKLRIYKVCEALFLVAVAFGLALLVFAGLSDTTFQNFMTAPMKLRIHVDVVILCGVIALITGAVAGLIPALYSTSFRPALSLKGALGVSRTGRMFRTALIGFQYVSSIVLFSVAMFMILQNRFMQSHPVGFNRDNIVCANTSYTVAASGDALRAKLMSSPRVKDVTFSAVPIISLSKMGWGRNFNGRDVHFDCLPVADNFLRFMGMEITQGRDFIAEDNLKSNGTFIFNEKAASEIGLKVGDSFDGHLDTVANIVGVVRNFNFEPMQYGVKPIALYLFGSQPWYHPSYLYVRIDGSDVPQTIDFISHTIKEIDPKLSDVNIQFLDATLGALYEKEQNQAMLIVIFAVMAMVIALVGVFGLVIFETQHRRREISLRKINGATVAVILGMFNRKFAAIVCVAFVVALPVAWYAVGEWLAGFAYRTPIHWWVFVAAFVVIMVVTVVTVTIRAWCAATENPVKALSADS